MKSQKTSKKKRLPALILAILLGGLGGHRFYVGKTGTAIAQLLLTLSIIGSVATWVWVIVDIIQICAGEFTDGENRQLSKWK